MWSRLLNAIPKQFAVTDGGDVRIIATRRRICRPVLRVLDLSRLQSTRDDRVDLCAACWSRPKRSGGAVAEGSGSSTFGGYWIGVADRYSGYVNLGLSLGSADCDLKKHRVEHGIGNSVQ